MPRTAAAILGEDNGNSLALTKTSQYEGDEETPEQDDYMGNFLQRLVL